MFKEKKSDTAEKMLACAQASASAYGKAFDEHVRRIRSLAEASIFREPLSLEHSMLCPVPNGAQNEPSPELLAAPMAFHLLARNYELLEDIGHEHLDIFKKSPCDERGNSFLFYIYRGFNTRENISSHWFDHYSEIAPPEADPLRSPNLDGVRLHDLIIREHKVHFIRFMLDAPHVFRFDFAEPDSGGRNILHHMADAPTLSCDDQFLFALLAKKPGFEKLAFAPDSRGESPAAIAADRSNTAFLKLIGPILMNKPELARSLAERAAASGNAGAANLLHSLSKSATAAPKPHKQALQSESAKPSGAGAAFLDLISEQALHSLRSQLGFCPTPEQAEELGSLARAGRSGELAQEISRMSNEQSPSAPQPARNYSHASLLPLEQAVKALNGLGLLSSAKAAPLHKRASRF